MIVKLILGAAIVMMPNIARFNVDTGISGLFVFRSCRQDLKGTRQLIIPVMVVAAPARAVGDSDPRWVAAG